MRKDFNLSLYLVTDGLLSRGRPLTTIVAEAVSGGVTLVQLREKNACTREFLKTALELKALLTPLGIPLIINDRMDIALAAGAEGLHVGQSDMPVEIIRKHMGSDAIIGLSVESVEDAAAANDLDIDYIGISPVFTTPTKKELTAGLGYDGIREIAATSVFPCVGIGGINISNIAGVINAGAGGAAVVSAICSADNPAEASRKLAAAAFLAAKLGVPDV